MEALYAELKKEWKQSPVVILQTVIFYNTFFLCLRLKITTKSNQGVQFMDFPSQIFFNDINHGYIAAILKKTSLWPLPFYMVVATYFYYEKMRRTMCTAIVSNLLKLNFFLMRFLSYLYTARMWLKLITSKAFRSSRSQMFTKQEFLKIL